MKTFIVLVLVVGATASHGWTSRLKLEHHLYRNNSWQSERYVPEFKNAVMEEDGQAMDDDRYTIKKAKQEVMDIEINFWCSILNMCQHIHYVSIVSGDEKPLDFYIAMKDLLEQKYGTQFSHPIEGQQEKYDHRTSLRKKFRSAFSSMTKHWQELLPGFPDVFHITKDAYRFLYAYEIYEFVRAYFEIMDSDAMEKTVERMEIIRDRFNSPETSKVVMRRSPEINSEVQVVENLNYGKVDIAEKIAHLRHLMEEILGFIFDIDTAYCTFFLKLSAFSVDKAEHAAAVDGFSFALEKLYGPLLKKRRGQRQGTFAKRQKYIPYSQMRDMSKDIYFNWWDESAMLSKRMGDTWNGSQRIAFMAWVKSVTQPTDELEPIVERLVEMKAKTINGTTETVIELGD